MSIWSCPLLSGREPRAFAVLAVLALLTPVNVVAAFNVSKATFSSGATAVSGGSFVLGGTTGEAGVVGATAGGSFRLIEGFWRPNMGVATSVTPWSLPLAPEPGPVRYENAFTGSRPNP